MEREVKNLQDAVNSINITEAMQREIIQNIRAVSGKKKYRFSRAAAVLIALLLGTLSIPVRAVVNSFLQARMEKVPEGELAAIVDDVNRSGVSADALSRPYSEEEKSRLKELVLKYREGTFPKDELAQADSVEEAERLGFCYLAPGSMFYLPDRELTDEEMLQIIDFHAKRIYAINKYAEEKYADEIAVLQNPLMIREQKKEEIVENGGIAEEKAVEIAEQWMLRLYGIAGDSLECRTDLSEYVPIADKTVFYHVKYTDTSEQLLYSFFIDVEDGGLAGARRYDESGEEKKPAVTQVAALLPELGRSAVAFAKERMQLTYEDLYYAYYSADDLLNPTVSFLFVREDNSAFTLEYAWDGTFVGFQKSLFSTCQEEYEDIKASAEWIEKITHKGEEAEISIFFEKIGDEE